ncbi:phage repressor protein CI [Lelliottia sp.]|uniref:phage repressor protein CI n=1 Tax=Lelliottia sp. TaxID=1898429 RepID=UPI00388E0B71
MFESESSAQEIIERLCAAYGVKSQRELAKSLEIPANNVSAWAQRESVPGNSIIKCALDTGADLAWLVSGKLANANPAKAHKDVKGRKRYEEILSNGGRVVLRRILDAYGFTTQRQLCDLLDISSGTVSTWVRRDFFPGDIVITCALDTGASLEWLSTGKTSSIEPTDLSMKNVAILKRYSINSGLFIESGEWITDKKMISSLPENCGMVEKGSELWLVDFDTKHLSNGRWLISIDGSYDIYDVVRIPGNRIHLSNAGSNFECNASDVICAGQVKKSIINN